MFLVNVVPLFKLLSTKTTESDYFGIYGEICQQLYLLHNKVNFVKLTIFLYFGNVYRYPVVQFYLLIHHD